MKKLFALILLSSVGLTNLLHAKNYYFSSTGNDLNAGDSQSSPYKTIAKLNTLTLAPGDNVYFKRGETFVGQIDVKTSGTSAAYITFDAYGTGSNPVITGAVRVHNWRLSYRTMYVTDVPGIAIPVTQVFYNKALMTLARYPNTGYLTIGSSSDKSTIFSNQLTQADNYWAGCTLVARTERWVYENLEIASNSAGKLKTKIPADYDFKSGFGFFITNKQNQLDVAKEWFHDISAKKIYFIAPTMTSPNEGVVEASAYNHGFNLISRKFISINNLTITQQASDGIYIENCSNIIIKNNTISYCFRNAISTGRHLGKAIQVLNNKINNIGNNGIDLHPATGTIKNNTLKRIALIPGAGDSGDGRYIGIMAGPNSNVSFNTLDSIGYNGIHGHNGDTLISNYISNVCLTKDDGAGIYCYKSNRLVIRDNIVRNAVGNGLGTVDPTYTAAHGIYLDDSSSYCTLTNNTVMNGDYGLFLHNSFNNTVTKNVFYNNRKAQITLQNDRHVAESVHVKQNSIKENVFYALDPNQLCLYLWTHKNNIAGFATFDRNYYCNPYSTTIAKTVSVPYYPSGTLSKNQVYNYTNWAKLFVDPYSKITKTTFGSYYSMQTLTGNLIPNSNFLNGKGDWYRWGSSNFSISLDPANILMTNNSLKSEFNSFALNSHGFYASGDFTVLNGEYYRLQFKANSSKISNLDFDVTQSNAPYKSLEVNKGFLIDKNVGTYDYVFKSNVYLTDARLMFSSTVYDSTLWMDDVSLVRVSADTNTSRPRTSSPIFINPTGVSKTITLTGSYKTLDGTAAGTTITIPPYSSKVLTKAVAGVRFADQSEEEKFYAPPATTDLVASPVPAKLGTVIHVDFPGEQESDQVEYTVINMGGAVLQEGTTFLNEYNRMEIPTTGLSEGLLYVKLVNGSSTRTAKIILY